MSRIGALLRRILFALPDVFRAQQSGVALLTLLPFMMSGIVFRPFNAEAQAEMVQSAPLVFVPGISLALVALCVLTLIFTRNVGHVISLVSALVLLAIAAKSLGFAGTDATVNEAGTVPCTWLGCVQFETLYTLYTLTGILTFLVIAGLPTISRPAFRIPLVFATLDAVLMSFGADLRLFSFAFISYSPLVVSLLLCGTFLMLLRACVKWWQENRRTFRQTRAQVPGMMKRVLWRSFTLWWLMPLIFVGFALFYAYISATYVRPFTVTQLDAVEAVEGAEASPDVEQAVIAATQRVTGKQEAAMQAAIKAKLKDFKGSADEIPGQIRGAMPKRLPGTETRGCFFLDIPCHVSNGIKNGINSAYVRAREQMIADIEQDLRNAKGSARDKAARVLAGLDKYFETFNRSMTSGVSYTADGMRYFGWASLIYGLMVLFKSATIVFSRVFYSEAVTTPVDDADADRSPLGHMQVAGARYNLRPDAGLRRFYVTFQSCGNNVIDRRRIPQPSKMALRRLAAGSYAMCLIDFDDGNGVTCCDVIVDPPSEIVVWDLRDGEEVFFDIKALIGFSEGCTLRSRISLSLGALIFGKAIYRSVTGPGRVLLRTRSAPLAGADESIGSIMQASSLIGWRRDAAFNVISSLNKRDIFFSGYSIRKADRRDHVVVYDTSQSRRVGTSGGILRFVRAFLLPI